MSQKYYQYLTDVISSSTPISCDDALKVLDMSQLDTLELLHVAYYFRQKYFGKTVSVHILNNVQNGMCPEDCRYCAQSASSTAPIESYSMKSDAEIFMEAKEAKAHGAMRYCMVFSGKGPADDRISHLTCLIREIKKKYAIEVCVSAGVIDRAQARLLKESGLDRLNHNLNTSKEFYHHICSSHSYEDRLKTLEAAHAEGLAVCSGVIIGMGEGAKDVYDMALALRRFGAESIPVNFLIPISGIALKEAKGLSPEYCLRVLCLFRFLNPKAEIRMAAGREMHLCSLEPLGLYAANSLFLQGYLNARGSTDIRTLTMIKEAGFSIISDMPLDQLLLKKSSLASMDGLKNLEELRPFKEGE